MLVGCGSTTTERPNEQQLLNDVPASEIILSILPSVPNGQAERLTAAAGYLTKDGTNTYAQSSNTSTDGTTLILQPGADEIAFAIYEFPTRDCTWNGQVEFDININVGEEIWLAWPNYEKQLWELFEESMEKTILSIPDGVWLSPYGDLYIGVVAFDESQVRVNRTRLPVSLYESHVHDLSVDPGAGGASLAVVGSRPAVAFIRDENLTYARATSDLPGSVADWNTMDVYTESENTGPHLVEIAGKPFMAFRKFPDGIRFAHSVLSTPDMPTDWTNSALNPGTWNSQWEFPEDLAEVDGVPAIVAAFGDTGDLSPTPQIMYVFASQPSGTGWSKTNIKYFAYPDWGVTAQSTSLCEINNLPVVSYSLNPIDLEDEGLWIAMGYTSNPEEPEDWLNFIVDNASISGTRLVAVNNHPVVAYVSESSDKLKVAISTTDTPASSDDFEFFEITNIDPGAGSYSLAAIDNRPAVAYFDEVLEAVMLVWWNESYPAELDSWHYFQFADGITDAVGVSLADLDGWPIVTYFDNTSLNTLKFARLAET
jgi:hypothetical protein